MTPKRHRMVAAGLALVLSVVLLLPPGLAGASVDTDPALTVPSRLLAGALRCPTLFRHPEHEPVLLVHATGWNAEESWGWNYARALPSLGFDVCTVDLPDLAFGDIQVSSEYVVHAIRTIAAGTGGKVDVVGHSQGALEPRWAARWWPSIRDLVDDQVDLAGVGHGIYTADAACAPGSCTEAFWQMRHGSRLLAALNSEDETPGGVSYTTVYSLTDQFVQQVPTPTSPLEGASNILIQDLCPGRPVDHIDFVSDAVVFEVVLDALTHPGPADPGRFDPTTCSSRLMAGIDPLDAVAFEAYVYSTTTPALALHDTTDHEPPLAPYAGPG